MIRDPSFCESSLHPEGGQIAEQSAPVVSEAPWSIVAHKGGKFGGACIFDIERESITEFILEFLEGGYTVTPVANRDEYNALCWRLDQDELLASTREVQP